MKPVQILIHQNENVLCRKAAVPGQGTAAFLCSTGIDIIQEKNTIYLVSELEPLSHSPSKKASPRKRETMGTTAKNAGI